MRIFTKEGINKIYRKYKKYLIIALICFSFYFVTQTTYVSDDLVNIEDGIGGYNPFKYSLMLYLFWSGRTIIEFMMSIAYKIPLFVFMMCLSACVSLFVYSIERITKIFHQYFTIMLVVVAIMATGLPLLIQTSGFIATNVNYFIPFSFFCYGFYGFFECYRDKNKDYILNILSLFIGCAIEVTMALGVGIAGIFSILYIIKKRKFNWRLTTFYIPIIIMLLLYIGSIGVDIRSLHESFFVPGYMDYDIQTKINIGLAYLGNGIVIERLIMLFNVVMLIVSCKNKRIVGIMCSLFTVYVSTHIIVESLPPQIELIPEKNALINHNIALIIGSIASTFFSNKKLRFELTIFTIAAFCTKLIMGFSPTYYRSGSRLMIFMVIMLFIIGYVSLFTTFKEKAHKNH